MSKRALRWAFPLAIPLLAVGVVVVASMGLEADGIAGTAPSATAMAGLNGIPMSDPPAVVDRMPADMKPGAAGVHMLGDGIAYAWLSGDGVCYVDRSGAGGCFDKFNSPVNATIGDDDLIGGGGPASVRGLVTDDVAAIHIVLEDGERIRGEVVSNAFEVYLPDAVAPWDVKGEQVTLKDGSTVFVPEDVPRLPGY
jgi:hypothetical protein